MEKNNQIQSNKVPRLWIIVFVIVAVLIIGLLMTTPSTPVNSPEPNDQSTQESSERENTFNNMLLNGENAIHIENQRIDDGITIKTVLLKDPGYIVIYDDSDGVPREIIGTSELIKSGESEGVLIKQIIKNIKNDSVVYYSMLHKDDGDEIFDLDNDHPITDKDGNIILMTFVGE